MTSLEMMFTPVRDDAIRDDVDTSPSPHVRKNGLKYLQQKSYCMHQIKAAKISVQNNLGHSNTRNNGVICIFLTARLPRVVSKIIIDFFGQGASQIKGCGADVTVK